MDRFNEKHGHGTYFSEQFVSYVHNKEVHLNTRTTQTQTHTFTETQTRTLMFMLKINITLLRLVNITYNDNDNEFELQTIVHRLHHRRTSNHKVQLEF